MKLINKQTGEIRELPDGFFCGDNLKKICEEWKDYEEPKKYWYISDGGEVYGFNEYFVGSQIEDDHRAINNLFETKEEAEKAVEKLKAWKRLKDNGFRFQFWSSSYSGDSISFFIDWINADSKKEIETDLDLLFGGEE